MAEDRPGRHRDGRRLAAGLAEQALEIERKRRHLDRVTGERPFVARPVAVELDAVPLRVGEVERLGDEMVGGSGERPARTGHPAQRACEVGPRRHEEREVEEAGRPRRARRRVRIRDELDERRPVDAERDDVPSAAERLEADRRLVELAQPVDVAGAQPDRAEPRVSRQPAHRRRASSSAQELMQNRFPVGCGPSSKTWPRCPPQVAQTTSSRTMPWLVSSRVSTASSSAGSTKLGQPEPESNFASERNSSAPHPAQR